MPEPFGEIIGKVCDAIVSIAPVFGESVAAPSDTLSLRRAIFEAVAAVRRKISLW
jgi:hypothetical protein